MADIKKLIESALSMAKMAAPLIPVLGSGVAIGEKIMGIIDDLSDDVPDARTQEAMQKDRAMLAEAVKAKAAATSDRLRGH
jgi:hypothetical protein